MRFDTSKRLSLTMVALTTAVVMLAVTPALAVPSEVATETPVPAPAAPVESPIPEQADTETAAFRAELARKQALLDELEAQLDALDRELAIAAEAYNKAVMELESTKRHLDATKSDLANAEVAYEIQQDTLSDRARDLYRDGEMRVLDVLLSAKSVSDLVDRIKFLHSMGESDADIAAALAAQRDQIALAASALEDDEVRARSLEFELQARQIEVMIRIRDREALLAAAQADLLALLDSRVSERQTAEAELLRQVLDGANKAGIVVQPGSPVETALGYHGVPYLWGGESPRGFDCSGLVLYVYRQHGVNLPHYSGAQFQLGTKVAPADLTAGDVVFFGSPVYHVGMYVGAGYFIHAPRTGDFVKLSKLADRKDYAGARRYDWSYRTGPIANAVVDPAAAVQ
jgi:cell wall-associated NlpC family hydrolase